MKIRLLIFALLLAFALPAWGTSYLWTNTNACECWNVATNWTPNVPAGPVDGDTLTFDGNENEGNLPASNQPNDGSTFHFIFTGAYNFPGSTLTIQDDILAGGADVIGHIEVDNASAVIVPGANFGAAGTGATLTDGYLSIEAGPRTCTGDIIVVADNTNGLSINGVTLAVSGGTVEMQADTYLAFFGAAVLDLAEPMRVEGDGNHYIDFNDGGGDIYGGIDASSDGTSRQVLVVNTAGAGANIVQGGVTGDLDLGTDGAGGLADWSAVALFIQTGTVTMAADANVYRLTVISGELVGAAKTITADAGGFTFVNGTISGTLDVDLSAAAGAYTQTDGEIAADAVLNVTTGTGATTFTALTKTGTLNVTCGVSGNYSWDSAVAAAIDTFTINAGQTATQTDTVYFVKLSGGATATLAGAARLTYWQPATTGDWDWTGTISGSNTFVIQPTATPLVFTANPLNVGARALWVGYAVAGRAITLPGLTCGALTITPSGTNNTTTLTINGNSSGTTVTLGSAAEATRIGVLTLGPNAVHRWTGAILRVGTGTTHALNPQGRCIFTGTFTGTDIAVTPTYEGMIDCEGVGIVTDVTATGRRLVVRRAVDSVTGIPVRSWNGDSGPCTNVRFLGPLIIGAPGVN